MVEFIRDFLTFNKRDRNGILFLVLIVLGIYGVRWTWNNLPQQIEENALVFTDRFDYLLEEKDKDNKYKTGNTEEGSNPFKFKNGYKKTYNSYSKNKDSKFKKDKDKNYNSYSKNNNSKFKTQSKNSYPYNKNEYPNWTKDKNEQTHKYDVNKDQSSNSSSSEDTTRYAKPKAIKLTINQSFDPNQLDYDQALAMGLPEKLCQTLDRYLSKNGKFYKTEDLKKIYGMTDEFYNQMEAYIAIPKKEKPKPPPKEKIILPLNTASTDELQQIDGVGEYFASAIVKYRNLLGGYSHIDQLLEVYHMDEERLAPLRPYLSINTDNIRKINLNTAKEKDLTQHPYMDYKTAKHIIKLRRQHGPFTDLEPLRNTPVIDSVLFEQIAPYLSVE